MDISVILPNYNGKRLLEALLPQVLDAIGNSRLSYEIIVADDCSTDGSVDFLLKEFPEVIVAEGASRLGFAGNCNRGAKLAKAGFLAFVNTDIALDGEPFSGLVSILCERPDLFAVMPIVYAEALARVENFNFLWKKRGLVWLKPILESDFLTPEEVARHLEGPLFVGVPLCGAFFVCSRDKFFELGGFDESFSPAYWEDVDLGLRAEQKGYKTALARDIRVRHLHSQTINSVFAEQEKRTLLLLNQARFIKKNLPALSPIPYFRFYLLLRAFHSLLRGDAFLVRPYLELAFLKSPSFPKTKSQEYVKIFTGKKASRR